ncbi:hypothetical protein ACJIZ3_015727 [Penstemon smallii]|uniref:Uncharacterized protein n=1 Tax=Penstemon smallii TaxID=265156 RepID=A0ABD3RNC2_9LAMI
MEKSEPALVPEWLKNSGSSISHSDDHAASRIVRNKSFVNSNGHDFGRPSSTDRTTSSYFRRSSSSNGSGNLRSYSSFSRNQRDRGWEKDAYNTHDSDKLVLGDRRHRDFSDPPENILSSKFERDGMRRSQSMISGKRVETWHKKVSTDSSNASGNNVNGLITKGSPVVGVNKATFERDFPSLGAEEKEVIAELGRIPSPGLSSAIQSLPIGTSAAIGGEKWTSALAEVPVLVGSSGTPTSSVQQAVSSSSLGTSNLNMAEAVAQGPSRAQTAPQVLVGSQRLEELAVKQSRQLIPVTPSMPKTLPSNQKVHILDRGRNSTRKITKVSFYPKSDKHILGHGGIILYFISDYVTHLGWCRKEILVSTPSDKQKTKVGQQPVNHSPRGGPVKAADVSKSSNVGKLQILKLVREKNGVTPVVKDTLSPKSGDKVISSTAAAAAAPSPSTRGPPKNVVVDRKPMVTVLEKRPTSQAKSRNDFFNSVRKKSLANSSSVSDSVSVEGNSSSGLDNGTAPSPTYSDKGAEMETPLAGDNTPLSDHLSEESGSDIITCNGDAPKYDRNRKKHPSSERIVSEEEEAAFLRSLGWEENADEGGLTEEEISAFYRDFTKYINSKPLSLGILHGLQTNFLLPLGSQIGGIAAGISSGLSSSADTKLES